MEDNNGSQTISLPLTSAVATDNRTFETLESWGVELSAAAVALTVITSSLLPVAAQAQEYVSIKGNSVNVREKPTTRVIARAGSWAGKSLMRCVGESDRKSVV